MTSANSALTNVRFAALSALITALFAGCSTKIDSASPHITNPTLPPAGSGATVLRAAHRRGWHGTSRILAVVRDSSERS